MGGALNYETDCALCGETSDNWEESDGITPDNKLGQARKICDDCLKCKDGVKTELEWKRERCEKCGTLV